LAASKSVLPTPSNNCRLFSTAQCQKALKAKDPDKWGMRFQGLELYAMLLIALG